VSQQHDKGQGHWSSASVSTRCFAGVLADTCCGVALQVTGTTIFLLACICGFPGVLPTNYAAGDWVYWDVFFW
jgi:hypothetical protein